MDGFPNDANKLEVDVTVVGVDTVLEEVVVEVKKDVDVDVVFAKKGDAVEKSIICADPRLYPQQKEGHLPLGLRGGCPRTNETTPKKIKILIKNIMKA